MIDGGAVSTPVSHDPPADRTAAPGGGVLIVDDQVPFRSVARTLVGML
jgi:hypothetical protein